MLRRIRARVRKALRDWWWKAVQRHGTTGLRWAVNVARVAGMLPRRRGARAGEPETFLVVNLTPHLGDTIMMMPMLEELRRAYPGAQIECAVEAGAAPLLRMMPIVDRVYALRLGAAPPVTVKMAGRRLRAVLREFRAVMGEARPTVSISPRWGNDLFRSNWVAYLSTASRRIGFGSDVDVPRNYAAGYRDRLLTEVVRGGNAMHEPERFCYLLRAAGVTGEEHGRGSAAAVESLVGIAGQTEWNALAERLGVHRAIPFAVIAPAASQPRKVWPMERWAEVMRWARGRGFGLVLLSGKEDAWMVREVHEGARAAGMETVLVAGVTSLAESATLLRHAGLFLGNDSGPGHIAGALGVPSVVLFAGSAEVDGDDPFSPVRNGPIGPYTACLQPRAAVRPCERSCVATEAHCIRTIETAEVIAAAEGLLRRQERAAELRAAGAAEVSA